MLDSNILIKYLKEIGFPHTYYDACKVNPAFSQKYKKKFQNDIFITVQKKDTDLLYYKSLPIISQFQTNLKKKKIETYIAGGSSVRLYSFLDYKKEFTQNDIESISTSDFDIVLFTDKKNITIKILVSYIIDVINSYYLTISKPYYMTLQLNVAIPFHNIEELDYVLKYFLNKNFDLQRFIYDSEKNKYSFLFIILFKKDFCIKLRINFVIISQNFFNTDKHGVIEIYHYYFDTNNKFKLTNIILPTEVIIARKSSYATDLVKNSINYNGNVFYLYNKKAVLYNLVNMQYKYEYLVDNMSILGKKKEQKNVRDYNRLKYFLRIYCNECNQFNNNKINKILNKLLENKLQFNIALNKVTNLKMIDNIFENYS